MKGVLNMTSINFFTNRSMDINELKEVLILMENQETTDKFHDTSLHINGDFAVIDVDIDKFGDVTLI